jgi:hypothetical protein
MKKSFGLMAMALALGGCLDGMSMPTNNSKKSIDDIDFSPKKAPIPKGCQKYVFKESFGTLEVIALNEKSALKKYNKWCELNAVAV